MESINQSICYEFGRSTGRLIAAGPDIAKRNVLAVFFSFKFLR